MNKGTDPIPFFTDNDVPEEVGGFLEESGHSVIRLRKAMLVTSADPVVAAACREHGRVLITHNIRHFRAIVRQYEVTKAEVDRLCRIEMGCHQAAALDRMRVALPLIEFEWSRLGPDKTGLRFYIGDTVLRTHR